MIIVAKRKQNQILRSLTLSIRSFKPDDLLPVHAVHYNEEQGSLSDPPVVLFIYQEGASVTVSIRDAGQISAAFVDISSVRSQNPLATLVHSATDQLDCYRDSLRDIPSPLVNSNHDTNNDKLVFSHNSKSHFDCTFGTSIGPNVA